MTSNLPCKKILKLQNKMIKMPKYEGILEIYWTSYKFNNKKQNQYLEPLKLFI